ncbi:MAG: Alanyl-tRNA editing protein AlaX-M [archaeon GW2011_AR20]|nr:MAG: Alanyl-tRNA editing protein AlaX-M [archaeon GW2011_AR20]MBS3160778.1 alanyl-tRNA editing protein [Candidatus Woesearchaeota archaeon]
MTQKLFLEDSYLKEFEAEVVSVNDKYVVLDKTLFYPKSGGQSNDTGTLTRLSDNKEFQVVFAAKINDDISQEVNESGLQVNDKVHGKINWERRYKLMKLHTAAHVLDAVFHEDNGVLITGNELTQEKGRIDFNLKDFSREKVQAFIDKANEIINKDLEVKNYSLNKEEAMKIPGIIKLAKAAPPDLPILRITEISGLDTQADAGTHVKSLREIGKIVFLGIENKGKDRKRVYFDVQ